MTSTTLSHQSPLTGWAEVNGARLYYELMGEGPAVVLIHAGIADHRMWADQFGWLAQHYQVLCYDVRRFGRSHSIAAAKPVTYTDHEDLYCLLQFLGIEKTALIGVSNGGRIALDFILAYPDLVAALIPVASALSGYEFTDAATEQKDTASDEAFNRGDIEQAVELTLQLWVDGPRRTAAQVDPNVRERVRQMMTDLCLRTEDGAERQPLDPPALSRLAKIHVPTLVLIGDHDVPDMLTIANLLAIGITGAEKIVIPGTAHLPNLEQVDQFNHIILDFLSKHYGEHSRD